jgi:hypothetical protein
MPELISPEGLEADAVVPQCLDNQYVSDHVFQDMISRGVDYVDAKVAAARERDFRTEFIRSLIYSSQVVIQRAFLKNSDFLYKNYELKEGDDSNLRAFAALMRKPEPAIIPFLFKESSLTDNLQFDVRKEGDAALRALLDEAGDDVRCVRLAINDTANSDSADSMATIFGEGLTRLRHLGRSQRNAMASELFAGPSPLQDDVAAWDAFQNAVNSLAVYAFNKAGDLFQDDEKITRTNVYIDRFIAGSSDEERKNNVALGRFRAPGKDDYLLEMKKYVDLVYNTNLPDRLRRYTFTPVDMPSRMALQDAPSHSFGHQQISDLVSDDETLEWVRRSFMERIQSAMDLPLLSDLNVADVLAIRGLPEWESFKNAQQQILQNPLRVLEDLPTFQESFDRFQRALSGWYNDKYKRDQTIQRYCNVVTWVLSIGGIGITAVAGSHIGTVPHDLLDLTIPEAAKRIPRRVKGYAAKLMVGVYDIGNHQLDANRSYSIELMRTNEELMREEVVELLQSVGRSENALPGAAGLIADQGIQ